MIGLIRFDKQQELPVIYYSYYEPASSSIPEVASQEHALGRELLLTGLENEFGIIYSREKLEEALIYGQQGKPLLRDYPEVHFNITHCSGLAACAFSHDKVGIDAELPGYFVDILIKRALTEEEKDVLTKMGTDLPRRQEWFYRFWTLKEAYVKKSGVGLDTDLKAFSFRFEKEKKAVDLKHSNSLKNNRHPSGSGNMEPAEHQEQRDTIFVDNQAQPLWQVLCSDTAVSCYQTRLSHGQILTLCY